MSIVIRIQKKIINLNRAVGVVGMLYRSGLLAVTDLKHSSSFKLSF